MDLVGQRGYGRQSEDKGVERGHGKVCIFGGVAEKYSLSGRHRTVGGGGGGHGGDYVPDPVAACITDSTHPVGNRFQRRGEGYPNTGALPGGEG